MSKQTINIGASPNDGTGTPLRTSFDYTNQNFTEIYTALGGGVALPGATTQVIFNDGGTNLAGDAGLVYNKTTDALTVAGLVTAGSATITGALTIGGATSFPASIINTSGGNPVFTPTASTLFLYSGSAFLSIRNQGNTQEIFNLTPAGVYTFGDGAGGTRMTLNSTGLGVGVTPAGGDGSGVFKAAGTGSLTASTRVGLDVRELTSGNQAGIILGAMTTENTGVIGSRTASGNIAFQTYNGSAWGERMRIDYLGNVGVGVTPSAWVSTYKALQASTYASFAGNSDDKLTAVSNNFYNDGTGKFVGNGYAASYSQYQGAHRWQTSTVSNSSGAGAGLTFTQAMTLDASGNLLVGTTSNAPAGTQSQFVNQWSGGAKWGSTFNQTVSSATSYTHIAFCTNGTVRGSIDANNATLTYGTVSDYRLKENVQPILNALTRIAALKPSTYKWKDSGTDGEGFIAHELAAVVPLAVIGQKDAVNEDGSIKAQQIDLSKVVPILVASIQELTARVQTLEAR